MAELGAYMRQQRLTAGPKAMPPVPDDLALDAAIALLWDQFARQDEVAAPVLAEHEALVRAAYPGWRDPVRRQAWAPAEGQRDRSTFVNERNEFRDGQLVAPGAVVIASWPLKNSGEIPWRDRLLFRVSERDAAGIQAPRFVPVPDTDPGVMAILRVPLRAPRWPGTYQICYKISWPNGVYCHPTTVTGVMATLVVPPRELAAWWPGAPPVPRQGQAPETLMTDPGLGPLLSAARQKARLTQSQLGELLTDLPGSRRSFRAISSVERGDRAWPLSAWHAAARTLDRFDDAAQDVAVLRSRLPAVGRPPAPATTWTTEDRRAHLRAMMADLTARPPRRQFTLTKGRAPLRSAHVTAGEILRRLDTSTTERPSPDDDWEVVRAMPPEGEDVGKKAYLPTQVTLRNTGKVPWTGRLLYRLGVTVSTVMPMTQRVVSVPDTAPGDSCTVNIPGRPAHIAGVTEVHYIMTFGDLRPCFPDERRTIRFVLTTTTAIGAWETLPVPATLVRAARGLVRQLQRPTGAE
jgi:hypothetical protein